MSKKKPAYTGLILHLCSTYTCLYWTYLTYCKKRAYIGLILHLYSTYTCVYYTYLTDCQKKSLYWSYNALIFYLYWLILHLLNRLSKNKEHILDLYSTYILPILAYTALIKQIVKKKSAYTWLMLHLQSTYTCLYRTFFNRLSRTSQLILDLYCNFFQRQSVNKGLCTCGCGVCVHACTC